MPKSRTAGARLRAWRESQTISGRKLAATLGVSPTTLGEWEEDHKTPRAFYQLQVQALTGIPLEAWLTRDEASALRRLRDERVHAPTIAPDGAGAVSP